MAVDPDSHVWDGQKAETAAWLSFRELVRYLLLAMLMQFGSEGGGGMGGLKQGGLKQITSTTLVCETLTNIYALPQILMNVVSQIPTGIYALSQSPKVARPVCVKIPAGTWYMSVQ